MTRRHHTPACASRLVALLLLASTAGCGGPRADDSACDRIFERIVELELRERGFHDPVLQVRKQRELHGALAPDLRRCRGLHLHPGALVCVAHATKTEQISHICLR